MNADRVETWGETAAVVFAAGLLGVMWVGAAGWVSRETALGLLCVILPPAMGLGLWLVWRSLRRLWAEYRAIERERQAMNREFREREQRLLGREP